MRPSAWIRNLGAASLLLPNALALAGCYSGLGGGPNSGGQDGAGEGADDAAEAGDGTADDGDTAGDDGPVGLCGDAEVGLTDLRRLTAVQYNNTIRDLLGIGGDPAADFSADERVGPFKSNVAAPIGDLQADQYMSAAEDIAVEAIADLGTLLPCDPASGEDACAEQFIADFAPRAYRRPLLAGEAERLLEVYTEGKAEGDFANGIRLVVQGVLQSPYFLYHTEFGNGDGSDGSVVALTDHELASRLSYFLWDSMPDDALFAAAEAGELSTEDGMMAQVDRMLADPKAREGIASFHLQWLGVDEVATVEKSPDYYPNFTPELAAAMREETAAFANAVVLDGDGTLATLLTADFTYTENPDLLALYGATLPPDHVAGDPVPLPAGQRAGLLTQASVMTRHAHANQTSPVHRGKMVRENLLCQILAPPPPEVDNVPPDPDPNATTRERFEQHREDPTCFACHNLIDGFGFGFEHYDGIGAWRDMDGVNPVDASGWVVGTDFDGDFDGIAELSAKMAGSELVAQCVSKQWFRFAFGRAETDEDQCTTEALDTAFSEGGQDVRVLIKQLVLSDSFLFRRGAVVGAESQGEGEVR